MLQHPYDRIVSNYNLYSIVLYIQINLYTNEVAPSRHCPGLHNCLTDFLNCVKVERGRVHH